MPDFADQLILELDAATEWPLRREQHARRQVAEGRALRKLNRDWLRTMAGWDQDREYVADPLARRIAAGFADFLFAAEPRFTTDGDQELLEETLTGNQMPARLHRAARTVVSEGEAWWKLHVNLATAKVPLVSWCSRLDVVPLFDGDRVLAAAFVTERARRMESVTIGDEVEECEVVYRHAEVHGPGRVVNVLYRGTADTLGGRVSLDRVPATAGYAEVWEHGLPILAGRVVNDLDDDDTLGVSEYEAVRDLLLALNEAMTISAENARLTGQDRIFVAGKFRQQDGTFDASLQVFEVEGHDQTLGEGGPTSIYGVEKHYDAEPLWLHIRNLVKTAVSRVGLVPQWIGEDVDGQAKSGTAIRLEFLPTTNAAKGKLREWGTVLPELVHRMLLVAELPIEQGGLGRGPAPEEPPAVEFGDPLPVDEQEQTDTDATAVTAGIKSRRTAIRDRHPDWSDEQVQDELDEIRADQALDLEPVPPPSGE